MTSTTTLAPVHSGLQAIIDLVTNAVTSEHTRRAYSRALDDFIRWHTETAQNRLDKATVQEYTAHLHAGGVSASSINQRLVAIRKLAHEAADNGLIDHATASAIARAKGIRTEGKRLGNWLSRDDAQRLLDAPDLATIKGRRDRALLAVMLGCALRREECVSLTVGHIQQRDGRWVIVDLVGKRQKTRSVPMPSWAKVAIDEWLVAGAISEGPIFRSVNRGGRVGADAMTAQAAYNAVNEYALALGLSVHPHDLRRTYAKLAHKGGAPLEQIQLSLGHSSVQTTERYLGTLQDLASAPCDVLGLRV